MIGIIDYRTGNSQSVAYALGHLGVPHKLVATPSECDDVDKYVLPGVGSAGVTMESLAHDGWVGHLTDKVVGEGVGFLGVCVGLQVLFEHSAEDDQECLGWIKGTVQQFDNTEVRVPHMGWNTVEVRGDHPLSTAFTPGGLLLLRQLLLRGPDRPGGARRRDHLRAAVRRRGRAGQHHGDAVPHREERPRRSAGAQGLLRPGGPRCWLTG